MKEIDALLRKLSGPSRNALLDFNLSAKAWGYEEDGGYGAAVDRAQRNYEGAYLRLLRRVRNLERDRKKYADLIGQWRQKCGVS